MNPYRENQFEEKKRFKSLKDFSKYICSIKDWKHIRYDNNLIQTNMLEQYSECFNSGCMYISLQLKENHDDGLLYISKCILHEEDGTILLLGFPFGMGNFGYNHFYSIFKLGKRVYKKWLKKEYNLIKLGKNEINLLNRINRLKI